MRDLARLAMAIAMLLGAPSLVAAASLQVAPVSLEVPAPSGATTLELTNDDNAPVAAQFRVFRWSQTDGVEKLEPTDAVVASPPAVNLTPHTKYTVRVIRLDPAPVAGEESYRVIVDELPDSNRVRNGAINIVLRYSIPLFFFSPNAGAPKLSWRAQRINKRLSLVATNEGQRHMRLSAMKAKGVSSAPVSFGDGLVGYVLGRSSMRFLSKPSPGEAASGAVAVQAVSNFGRVNAVAQIGK